VRSPVKMNNRKEIIRTYKQNLPEMGIFQIRCTANGKIYVAASRNLEGERNSRLFQLKMGKVVFNRELQCDLEQYGAGKFEFSVLAVLNPPQPGENSEQQLAALETEWLEKLRPFDARGYNNEKAYLRNKERLLLMGLPS
jgi:GIY-YIG catalytic domain